MIDGILEGKQLNSSTGTHGSFNVGEKEGPTLEGGDCTAFKSSDVTVQIVPTGTSSAWKVLMQSN